jgi:hypothetical protein
MLHTSILQRFPILAKNAREYKETYEKTVKLIDQATKDAVEAERKRKPTEKYKAYWKSMVGKRGEGTPRWKGDKASRSAYHKYLDSNYGKPKVCESPNCEGKSTWFDWCIKTGRVYSHDRNDYLRMCRSCHRKYDMTPEKRQQVILMQKKRTLMQEAVKGK